MALLACACTRETLMPTYTPSMSDDAVKAKTGKTWPEWFKLLDGAGGKKMDHKQIVAVLHDQYGVGPWWQQMVTVEYERSRGLRAKHETTTGFAVSASRTLNAPAAQVFKAWKDARTRGRWLETPGLVIRKSTPDKSLRITWPDGTTSLDVELYPKGDGKTHVTIQHTKLADAAAVKREKAFWAEALGRLKAQLEG
jgi:uncharacterized protein YndB with AHSA1/START domain